ncbi:MAG: hypothetical protein ACFFDU_07475 [Candidatus Thorarchaeota archaeon]
MRNVEPCVYEREHRLFSNFAQAETCGAKPAVAPAKQTVCGVTPTMYKRLFKLSIKRFNNTEKTYDIRPNNH